MSTGVLHVTPRLDPIQIHDGDKSVGTRIDLIDDENSDLRERIRKCFKLMTPILIASGLPNKCEYQTSYEGDKCKKSKP